MKKILSFLLTISIIFSCINISVFAETEGALSISAPTSAIPGETINVTVTIPSGTNAVNGSFNLVYDNTAFEVVSCTGGTILSDSNVVINKTYSDTKIRMSFDGEVALSQGGLILNVAFKVVSGASGTVNFEIEKFKLLDENYEAINISETAATQMYIVNDADTEMVVSCENTVNTGNELMVTVDISNSLNVCGGGFNLVYDSDKFTLTSATIGSVLSAFNRQLNKTYASNKVRLSWAGSTAMTEDGTLLTLVFTVKDGVEGTASFIIEKLSFGDVNGASFDGVTTPATTSVICTHNIMEWKVTEDSTCVGTGTETYMCGCGHFTDTRELAAKGHTEMNWIITKEATCDDSGIKEYTCEICGYVESTQEIAAHGHIYESVITPPTQAENGYTTHTCTGCGYSYTDSTTAATGYTISYNVSGGAGVPETQIKYVDETITLSLEVPTKEGYVFLGWTRVENETVAEYAPGSSYRENADAVLYAVWSANSHIITYVVDGETYAVQSYDYGNVIEVMSEPEKEGYVFSGWSEIPITMPDNDVTVFGTFTINTYNFILNTNNNDVIFNEQVVEHGTTINIPTEIPTLDNHTFIGWATSKTARKAEYYSGDKIVVEENITLYAVWNQIWNGDVAEGFAGGSGTITSPYRIENASHLSYMANKINAGEESYLSAYYILTNNISLNDISDVSNWAVDSPSNEWTPIGTADYQFSGVFDGNGYTIKGLYISKSGEDVTDSNLGLFAYADGASISNLGIIDSYINGYDNIGSFVGNAKNVKFKTCYNKGTVTGNSYVGGLVGNVSDGTTTNLSGCYNTGVISGQSYVGGICGGANNSIIYGCYNESHVEGVSAVGGVLGGGVGTYVSTSHNLGDIGFEDSYNAVGGVCGHLKESKVELCYNAGTISCYTCDFGGIAGFAGYGTSVLRSYNVGEISGTGTSGGIVGAMYYQDEECNSNLIENCLNTGNVTSTNWVGGVCGYLLENSTMLRCLNLGTVTADSNYGALSGYLAGTVSYSYYLSGSGPATSGTSLTRKQMQLGHSFEGFSDTSTGINMHDRWILQNNPYTAFPTLRNNDALTATPIEFELNGGYFDEYVYSIRTYAQGTNISRALNSLIVYNTSDAATGTNSYGREAIVNSRNEVISIGGNNNVVPFGGFILSGNGISSIWIEDNIEVGDKVYYNSENTEIKVYKKNPRFTCSYGQVAYLPTPNKDGYVFGGWYDENENLISYATKIYATDKLKLQAKWNLPEAVAETTYGTKTYKLYDTPTSYASAKKYCESIGGHLATITDEFENDQVAAMLSNGSLSGYVIGFNDILSEGNFVWETGEGLSYTNWSSGEPSDSTPGEDVVEIYTSTGMWNDIKDTYLSNRGFICEFDNYTPSRQFIYEGHLYQIYHSYEDGVSWENAKEFCENRGGHLATITSEEENAAILNALSEYSTAIADISNPTPFFWLGATDVNSEGNWEWVTNEEWDYTNWNAGQPDNANGKEHYLHLYTGSGDFGKWNDLPLTYSPGVSFICEFDGIYPLVTGEFNGHKYMVFDTFVSWSDAKEYCETIGGHLATVTSEEENNFISNLCVENTQVDDFYLGGTDATIEGAWEWLTGEEWNYTNWNDGEPNNSSSNEHYLQLYLNTNPGVWNDVSNKYYSGKGFICEIEPDENNEIKSGMHGNISWSLESGILHLSGEGVIVASDTYPWDEYNDEITNIVINNGITDIGYAFSNLTYIIENIYIPKSVTSFPENFGYGRIANVTYAGSEYEFNKLIPVDSSDFADVTISFGEYSIIYDGLTVQNVVSGETSKIIEDIPTKDGYEFLGWTTAQTSSTVKYEVGGDITPEKDITLYAVWKRNKFNITYVTAKSDEFGEWDDWQEDSIKNTATVNVDKRYRSRSMSYTTSTTTKTLDGWEYLRTESQYGTWVNNGTTSVDAINTVSKTREVRTVYVPPKYKTQYHYFAWYNTSSSMTYPVNTTGYTNLAEIWIDTELPYMGTNSTYGEYYGGSSYADLYGYPIYRWYQVDGSYYGLPTSSYPYFTRTVVDAAGYTEYYYRDIYHTHRFVKYGEWSDWRSEPISDSSLDVDIQYRQRTVSEELSFVEENSKIGYITTSEPTDDNYYCVGWATEADATEAEYLAGDEIELSNDIILYAVWKAGGEGSLDEDISWCVDGDSLVIEGSGEISNFAQGEAPWYEYRDKITTVIISDNITSVGDYAFYGLSNITAIELGGVKSIGEYSFSNCSSLNDVDISNVTSIGSYAFRYCTALTDVVIYSDETTYGSNVYSNCIGINNVIISDGVTEISANVLNNCGEIQTLSIPKSLETIDENAFTNSSFISVVYAGTKDAFSEILTSENTVIFDNVTCEEDSQTYSYTDFFADVINITEIAFEKKSVGLYVGESAQIITTITPSNTTETLIWSSDNETVATVDDLGNVTAGNEGISNIIAKSESGLVEAVCVVYVTDISNEAEPTIYCESVEGIKNGDTFDVNIALKNNPGIASMRLSLTYDMSAMTLSNVTDLGLIGEAVHSTDYSTENYILYWDNGATTTNFVEDGNIVTLTFVVNDNTKSGDYPIMITYDYNNSDIINCELIPVKFEVENGFATVKSFTYGDVNDDGKVNALDSAYLSRYIANWTGIAINLDAADVNKDGKVNALDSAILKRHIARWSNYGTLPY